MNFVFKSYKIIRVFNYDYNNTNTLLNEGAMILTPRILNNL